uniref:Gustatory receptor n=1 Tax=Anopheles epiroticus TaxID=199890 RepID=A0A182PR61_9DIPT
MCSLRGVWKFVTSHENLYDVVNMHLIALKICGDLFVSRNQRTGQLYVCWKSFASFIAQLICLILLVVGGYFAQQSHGMADATYLHHGTSILIRLSGVFAIVTSISNAIVGKRIWAILDCCDRFDKRMKMLNAPVDHRTQKLVIVGWTLLCSVGVTGFVLGFVFAILTNYANTLMQIVTIIQIIMFVMVIVSMMCQIVIVLYMASYRFYHLRRFYEVNFLPWKPASIMLSELANVNQFRRLSNSSLLSTVMDLYDLLREAMRLMHKAYSVQLLSMTVSNIPSPTLALFGMYRSFVTSNYDMQNLINTMAVSSLMYLMTYFLLIFLSTSIKYETQRLIESFHHFTNLNNVAFENMVKISADQINSDNIALHIGPTELNWKLAFSMLGTIISYLIILIQFDRTSVGTNSFPDVENVAWWSSNDTHAHMQTQLSIVSKL